MTKVLECHCYHPCQDQLYGKNNRLHNRMPSCPQRKLEGWRCTVCGNEKKP